MDQKNKEMVDILQELENDGIFELQIDSPEQKVEEKFLELTQEIEIPETEITQTQIKKTSTYKTWAIFIGKYILTSSLIFMVLLVTTNYHAYYNIVKSYVYQEEFQNTTEWLINSVQAASIKTKYQDQISTTKRMIEKDKTQITEEHSIEKLVSVVNKEDMAMNIEITPYENRVVIPKIWENIPLLDIKNRAISWEEELNDIFMEELEKWIIRYPGSAKPGEDGNTFIFGHSSNFPWIKWDYNSIFALLDKVAYGDDVVIYYEQKKYMYKITEKKVISPGDISILERNHDKPELTLMTCWPIGTTLNRLIVTGELIEEDIK